jgi:hypothetical protein
MPETVAPTIDEVVALVEQLGKTLERIDRDQQTAIRLCEQIERTAETVDGDSSWYYVVQETASVRDVLPNGGSEGDPLAAYALVRDLVELAIRRSS